jgi:hypothetical protein
MQKSTLSLFSLCVILVLGLSACKDDEPFVKPKLSFANETAQVAENGGSVEVQVVLDKAAPTAITIQYEIGGTAVSPADYSIVGTEGEVDIPQGQTSATIKIDIVNDATYEGNETIELDIQDVDSDDIEITTDDEVVITITEDDPQAVASFATTELTLKESDNEELLEIQVSLSAPAPQAITVQYTFAHGDGFAIDDIYGTAEEIPEIFFDFEVQGGQQQVTIAQGTQSAVIQLQIFSDFILEDSEKIEITLSQASNGAQIGTNNKMTITLDQEDGKVIALVWDDDYTDVDMDLFLWIGETIGDLQFIASSTNPAVDPKVELVFIPAIIQDAAFGVSYTYYSGTADPMNFEAHFVDFTDGDFADDFDVYPGTYTLANINAWDEDGAPEPAVVQTFRIEGGAYVDITDIEEPATGSRKPTVQVPSGIKKMKSPLVKASTRTRAF